MGKLKKRKLEKKGSEKQKGRNEKLLQQEMKELKEKLSS